MNRTLTNLFTLICAVLGSVVALVLTFKHYSPQINIGCSVTAGCEGVIESRYGHLGFIPTSIIGLGMYVLFIGLCLMRKNALIALHTAEMQQAHSYPVAATDSVVVEDYLDNRLSSPDDTGDTLDTLSDADAANMLDAPSVAFEPQTVKNPTVPRQDLAAAPRIALRRLDTGVWFLSLSGLIISWWLQYNAIFQLQTFCPWCLTSAFLVTLIFLLASVDYWLEGRGMTGEQKMLAGVSVFLLGLLAIMYGPTISEQYRIISSEGTLKPIPNNINVHDILVTKDLHLLGDPKAPVLIVEFADYMCPACKRASEEAAKIMKTRSKDFRLAFRNFPLPIPSHKWNRQAAAAAEAAALQGKFWEMHDLLYANQKQMEDENFDPLRFDDYARELGLDIAKFDRDKKAKGVLARIETDMQAGQIVGLNETPFFIIVHGNDMEQISGQQLMLARLNNPNDPIWRPAKSKPSAPPLATGVDSQGK